jgi:hypothetical protein
VIFHCVVRSNEAEEGEPEDVEDEQEPEGDDLIDSEVSWAEGQPQSLFTI